MAGSLVEQVAVVTGATRGIGQAIATRFAAEGARVVAVGRSLEPREGAFAGSLSETLDAVRAVGGSGIAVVADVADANDRRRIVEDATTAFGAPTILVNNVAAPRAFDRRFDDLPEEEFRQAVDVNVWAGWHLAQLLVPGMRARGAGWVLNISSRQAAPRVGPPYTPSTQGGACLYGATKAMIDRLTTGAAMDLHGDGIAVNALSPEAAVMTPLASTMSIAPESIEPMETFVEAALALCSGDPRSLTGGVWYSLGLVRALGRPVRTLDGRTLVAGWQPDDIDPARLFPGYHVGAGS